MGLVPAHAGFLELLREQANASGALLVLDEVISGFRVARGGARELTGVHGDLTIMGKVFGGGLPAAAVGGRLELMELLAPAGEVYQAGTLSGNPLAVAAGIATLQLLDESAYARLAAITEQLAAGLREAASERAPEHPIQIATLPGLLTVFFSERPVHDLGGAQACDLQTHAAWCRGLLARGVYPPPSQFEAWFPSLAHTAEQLERTMAAASAAFGGAFTERSSPCGARLEALLREQGGLMASLLPQGGVLVPTHNGTGPGQIAASGPRTQCTLGSMSCW